MPCAPPWYRRNNPAKTNGLRDDIARQVADLAAGYCVPLGIAVRRMAKQRVGRGRARTVDGRCVLQEFHLLHRHHRNVLADTESKALCPSRVKASAGRVRGHGRAAEWCCRRDVGYEISHNCLVLVRPTVRSQH